MKQWLPSGKKQKKDTHIKHFNAHGEVGKMDGMRIKENK